MPLVDPITMSSTLATRSPSKSSPTSPSKTAMPSTASTTALAPVALLDTPAASAVAHARPAVYLALLALRFGALVRDPVSELQNSLPVIAVGQLAYAVCCLPVAGAPQNKSSRKSRPGERKRNEASGPRPLVVSEVHRIALLDDTTSRVFFGDGSSRMYGTNHFRSIALTKIIERHSLARPHSPRHPRNLHPPRPLRRPLPRLHPTHPPLRRALCPSRPLPHLLLPRSRPERTAFYRRCASSL